MWNKWVPNTSVLHKVIFSVLALNVFDILLTSVMVGSGLAVEMNPLGINPIITSLKIVLPISMVLLVFTSWKDIEKDKHCIKFKKIWFSGVFLLMLYYITIMTSNSLFTVTILMI